MRESRAELTFFDLRVSYGTAEMSVGCGTRATEIRGCDNLPLQVDILLHASSVLFERFSKIVVLAEDDFGLGETKLVHLLVEVEARAGLWQVYPCHHQLLECGRVPHRAKTHLDSPAGPESRLEARNQQ